MNRSVGLQGLLYEKGLCHPTFTHDQEKIDALHNVVEELIGEQNLNALSRYTSPFDIEKPNQHDSKGEFMQEMRAVKNGIKHVKALIAQLVSSEDELKPMFAKLRDNIDGHATKRVLN